MRVIMFQRRFVEPIRNFKKTQTIRKTARCRRWDALSLRYWLGKPYRSRHCTIQTALCKSVTPIVIHVGGIWMIDCTMLKDSPEADAMAQADGFMDWREMKTWFERTHGLPFKGFVISWFRNVGEIEG